MKTEYYITFFVRGNDEVEDEYPTIASGFSNVKTATKFAEQTVGTVEIVGHEYNNETGKWEKTEEHIGFLDGVQQYHDEGYSQ